LINSNQSVGLIHDLWNLDKHGKLNRQSRSGIFPRIVELTVALRVVAEVVPFGAPLVQFDLTGNRSVQEMNAGAGKVQLVGDIVDQNGNHIADLTGTCEAAINAWTALMIQAGVPIKP
jgi:hypothetical protein